MITKILMPTDGSPTAKAAAAFAAEIAKAENASVEVLGVVHTIQSPDTVAVDTDLAAEPGVSALVQAQVDELTAQGVKATGKTLPHGQVYQSIVATAEEDGVDLIVMGTHGRSGLSRAFIGSVADRVVRHSTIPVLLVPKRS